MPEVNEKNYELILQEINSLREENKRLRQDFDDIVAFNKSLLNQDDKSPRGGSADRRAELEKKLKEGLRNG